MEWFKRNPLFYSILCLMLASALGGMWYASRDGESLKALKEQYEMKNRQLKLFVSRSPAPTKANLEQLDRNYADLMAAFSEAQSTLNLSTYDKALFFGQPPASHNDAFFMIAKYVEDARNLALSSGVESPEGYRYGFREYENVGPDVESIGRVHRQAKIMEALLMALFDSGISELVSIKRERGSPGQVSIAAEADVFEFAGESSADDSSAFQSLAFQLEFKGQSLSLRSFLNRVSSSSLPFSISEIEVRLDREAGSDESRSSILENPFAQPDASDNSLTAVRVPIIAENESFFVVTLEFLQLSQDSIAQSVDTSLEGGDRA